MSDKTKNIIERAFKTFVESFISAIIVGIGTLNYSDMSDKKKAITVLLFTAVATALSAMWNFVQTKAREYEENNPQIEHFDDE